MLIAPEQPESSVRWAPARRQRYIRLNMTYSGRECGNDILPHGRCQLRHGRCRQEFAGCESDDGQHLVRQSRRAYKDLVTSTFGHIAILDAAVDPPDGQAP